MSTPTAPAAIRKATVDELNAMLGRLQAVPGDEAAHYSRDCWSCIADLGMGSHCEEVSHTLVLSAEHWLETAV